jgi:hypothetical protein
MLLRLLLVFSLLWPATAASQATSSGTASDKTELAVIAAAIDSLYGRGRLVIRARSDVLSSAGLRSALSRLSLPSDLIDDFVQRNANSVDLLGLTPFIRPRASIDFISADSLAKLPRGNPDLFWRAFYELFPGSGGLINTSRPGIDAAGRLAVLLIGQGCGGRCGEWGCAILRNDGDRWRLERFVVWSVS